MVYLHAQAAAHAGLSLSLLCLTNLVSALPTGPSPNTNNTNSNPYTYPHPPAGGNYNHHQHKTNGYGYGPYAPNPVPDYTPNPHSDWVSFAPSGASPGFKCYYPYLSNREWEGCNEPGNRGCWIRKKAGYGYGGGRNSSFGRDGAGRYGWDVHTDYDNYAPVGVRRHYTYNVVTKTIYPDGLPKEAILFDGLFPGPLLEGCWGDELVVTVINSLPNQGTTIHWHGIRQLYTNDMDGVPVTQCPIARQDSFVYKFRLTQYGATWYHSHYSLQYAEGLAAPMLIYGPSSGNYDVTVKDVLVVNDWVHGKAEDAYQDEKDPIIRGASTDSILLNGMGQTLPNGAVREVLNKDIRTAYPVTTIYPGKKNRFFIINSSVATAFVFSIDGHSFTVINNDFVAVKPYTVRSIVVNIGQRYEIIINGLDDPYLSKSGNYWIRTQPADGCNRFRTGYFNTQSNPPSIPFDIRTGILHYHTASPNLSDLPTTLSHVTNFDCADLHVQSSLIPIVPWQVKKPLNNLATSTFYAAHQSHPETGLGSEGAYAHWLLRLDPKVQRQHLQQNKSPSQAHAGNGKPYWMEFTQPSLLNLENTAKNPYLNTLTYSSLDKNGFIYMVIDGALLPSTHPLDALYPNGHGNHSESFIIPPIAHPMHWHGSDVVLLGQSHLPFDPINSPKTWKFNNPPRRDTVTMPGGGYVAVAFKPDNPGVWLVHCHIAWHASGGLALQMVIQDDEEHIYDVLGDKAVNGLREGCKSWERDLWRGDLAPMLGKEDSGV